MSWWPPPTIKLFLLLLYNCNFTVRNYNVNIWYEGYLIGDPCERVIPSQRGRHPHVENPCPKQTQKPLGLPQVIGGLRGESLAATSPSLCQKTKPKHFKALSWLSFVVLELGRLQKLNSFNNGLRFAVWLGSNYGTHVRNDEEIRYRPCPFRAWFEQLATCDWLKLGFGDWLGLQLFVTKVYTGAKDSVSLWIGLWLVSADLLYEASKHILS